MLCCFVFEWCPKNCEEQLLLKLNMLKLVHHSSFATTTSLRRAVFTPTNFYSKQFFCTRDATSELTSMLHLAELGRRNAPKENNSTWFAPAAWDGGGGVIKGLAVAHRPTASNCLAFFNMSFCPPQQSEHQNVAMQCLPPWSFLVIMDQLKHAPTCQLFASVLQPHQTPWLTTKRAGK